MEDTRLQALENRIQEYLNFMGEATKIGEGTALWLRQHGFFNAPASSNHHGNYEGGLFDHSLAVAKEIVWLTRFNKLIWQRPESPYIVGMFHDLCKIDNYVWDLTRSYYDYNDNCLFKGHGDKSIILLSTLMHLTMEEVACIRYHMGAFTNKEEWSYYNRAVNLYPNVLWTHHADMIVSQVKGV